MLSVAGSGVYLRKMEKQMHRILVVDDEPSIGEALAMGLASQQFEVDVAIDGKTGLQLGETGKYDVLIVDLYLPDMDGIDVIQKTRARYPGIVSIVITANSTRESQREALQCGVSDYLEKPFALDSIKAAVRRAVTFRDSVRDGMNL